MIKKWFNETYTGQYGLLILRFGLGAMMLTHGVPKLLGFMSLRHVFPDPIGLGSAFSLILVIFAEVFCSSALILGVKTRWAVIPLIITMFIASGIVHNSDPLSTKELPILYLLGFVTILLAGGGAFQAKK